MSVSSMRAKAGRPLQIVKTNYVSQPVTIPDSFLSTTAANAGQVTYHKIDFSQTPLPEYRNLYAAVLDNVLSPSECTTLIRLAEQSTGLAQLETGAPQEGQDSWQPAMVNVGGGAEILSPDYRNSDRIIWDERTVVQRLLERCFLAEQIRRDLEVLDGRHEHILGQWAVGMGHKWRATRLNERMRFLRYGPGQFFKEHCDGAYHTPDDHERTFYTLHLYLNDSSSSSSTSFVVPRETVDEATTSTSTSTSTSTTISHSQPAPAPPTPAFPPPLIRGGATTFHSNDMSRRLDVDPKAGRVLIFQHRGLLHSGDEVLEGVKYTMRTDLLFEFDPQEAAGSPGGDGVVTGNGVGSKKA